MISAANDAAFLDLLYAAPLEPVHWVTVLERLADEVGAGPANLTRVNLDDHTGTGIVARADPSIVTQFYEHHAAENPMHRVDDVDHFIASWRPTVFTSEALMDRDEYLRTAYHNELHRPIAADWLLLLRLTIDGRDVSSIAIGRRDAKGPYSGVELDRLRRLQPHLIRAYALTSRMAAARTHERGGRLALDRMADAVFLLADAGRIMQVNRAGERLLAGGHGLGSIGGRLNVFGVRAAATLATLIARAGSRDPQVRTGGSMTLLSPRRRFPLSLTVAPLLAEAPTLFVGAPAVLVCVTDPGGEPMLSADRLRDIYQLTDAECRIALALFKGLSPRAMAARFGVSPNTIRVQLGSVFAKTGTHRQVELVRLLMGGVEPPDRGEGHGSASPGFLSTTKTL